MLTRTSLLIGLGFLAIGPALADVVDVTVNGTVSGGGYLTVYCDLSTPGCEPPGPAGEGTMDLPYSFGGTNTHLGAFSESGGVDADPFSISAYAGEDTTATPESLGISLTAGWSCICFNQGFDEYDNISVYFDLTTESVIQLQQGGDLSDTFNSGVLLDSHGNVILPGILGLPGSAILQPGMYQLDASMQGGGDSAYYPGVEYDLTADFTPVATPEPRWALVAAFLAVMSGGYAVSRRRRFPH